MPLYNLPNYLGKVYTLIETHWCVSIKVYDKTQTSCIRDLTPKPITQYVSNNTLFVGILHPSKI